MSATNHTTNYELPIFVGSDKPAWLVDWNSAMTAIDTAIHTAEGKADQAGTDIGGIESSISTINSTLTSINNAVSQLRIDTNANTGAINTIQELIGNGTPTTTDKTIIGAINELNARPEHGMYELWYNSNLSAEFTPQTILIDYDESVYDAIILEYEPTPNESMGARFAVFDNPALVNSNHGIRDTGMYITGGLITFSNRNFAFSYDDTNKKLTITVAEGRYGETGSLGSALSQITANNYIIPIRVLALKHNE